MREILFRGKTPDGDWTYGYYVFTPKRTGAFGQVVTCSDFDRHYILTMKFNIVKEVIFSTVGQYTGLTDKKGNKIFEGDILCVDIVSGVVLFKNGCFVFHWKNNDKYRSDFYKDCIFTNYGRFNELEVIGNIHDNPELLKGGAE